MKRTLPWSENDSDSSSDESSSRDTNASSDSDEIPKRNKKRSSKTKHDEKIDLSKFGGLNVEAAFIMNGRKSLPIEFDKYTFKPVGNNESLFKGCIENWIGYAIPPYHEDWDHVPTNWVKGMISQIEHFFQLDRYCYGAEWMLILCEIERFCKHKYKDQKKKLKQHFLAVGGYEDVETAKKHPPTHISSENWNKTIDYFLEVDRSRKLLDLASRMTYDGSSSASSSYETQMVAKVLGERCGHDQDKSMATPPGTYTADDVKFIIDQFNEIVHQTNLNQQALLEAFMKGNPIADVPTLLELKPIVMPPPRQPQQHTNDNGDEESGR